jgi:hypothetical protein
LAGVPVLKNYFSCQIKKIPPQQTRCRKPGTKDEVPTFTTAEHTTLAVFSVPVLPEESLIIL